MIGVAILLVGTQSIIKLFQKVVFELFFLKFISESYSKICFVEVILSKLTLRVLGLVCFHHPLHRQDIDGHREMINTHSDK